MAKEPLKDEKVDEKTKAEGKMADTGEHEPGASINEPPGSEVIPPVEEPPPEVGDRAKAKAKADDSSVGASSAGAGADPDELEDEIEQAKDDGDVKSGKGKGGKK